MSIINKVLRDIDERNQNQDKAGFDREVLDENGFPKKKLVYVVPGSKASVRQLVIVGLMLVVVAVFGYTLIEKMPYFSDRNSADKNSADNSSADKNGIDKDGNTIVKSDADENQFFNPADFEEDAASEATAPEPESKVKESSTPQATNLQSNNSLSQIKPHVEHAAQQQVSSAALKQTPAEQSPVKLMRIEKEEIEGGIRLTFPLSRSVNMSVRKSAGLLNIDLPNTILVEPLKRLVDSNGLLHSIDIHSSNNNLTVELTIHQAASIQNYSVHYDDGEDFIVELVGDVSGPVQNSKVGDSFSKGSSDGSSSGSSDKEAAKQLDSAPAPNTTENRTSVDPVTDYDLLMAGQKEALKENVIAEQVSPPKGPAKANNISHTILNSKQKDTQQYEDALALVRTGRYTDAMESLRAFVSTHTEADKSLTLLADVMIKQGLEEKLEDILEDLNMQDHLLYAYIKARIAVARGDYETAILLMESKQVLLAGNEQYYVYLAGLYQKTGKFEKAVTLYKRLVKVISDNPSIWLGLAVSADGMSDSKVALLAFSNAQHYSYGNEIDEYITRRVKFLSSQ